MEPTPGGDGGRPVDGAVLVTVDSLRADALDEQTAPTLTGLASRATRFDRCFAHGNWTPFAFPSILGSSPVFSDTGAVGMPSSPTLAEVLSDDGVTTAGFNAANGFLTPYWDYDRGFDEFDSFIDDSSWRGSKYLAAHPTVHAWGELATSPLRRALAAVRRDEHPQFVDVSNLADVERRATAFLESVDGPFFLWVHYMDVHTPYVPAPRHLRAVGETRAPLLDRLRVHVHAGLGRQTDDETLRALRSLYRGAVHQVDASVGRLLDALDDLGRRDSTLVAVTGDHGEEFQDHGHLAHYPKLYDELVRVPLLVDHPETPGGRVANPVGHRALPPTICDALGVETDAFDAASLRPALEDGAPAVERGPVTSLAVRGDSITQQPIPRRLDEGDLLVSARTRRYTYIYHTDTEHRELYDRSADPSETRNQFDDALAPGHVVDRLHDAVEDRLAELHTGDADDEADHVPNALDSRLEALGYR